MEEASDEEKTKLKQKYREKKNAANKAVAKARHDKQQEWCMRIEEDGGFIFKLARDRDRDSKDTSQTPAMKTSDGTLVTGVKQGLCVFEEYFKKLLNPEGECEIEIPHYVRRELEVRTITEEVEKAVKKMKTGKAVGVDELSVEMVKANELVRIKWLTSLFSVCFITGDIPAECRRLCQYGRGKGTSMTQRDT